MKAPKLHKARPAHVRLREWRERAGMTVEQAAQRVGVYAHTFQGWESGDTAPRTSTAFTIEELTGVDWAAWLPPQHGWKYNGWTQ